MSSNEENKTEKSRGCGRRHLIKIPFIIAAIVFIKSAVVMLLWNTLIPDLFHGPDLNYWQAVGVTILVHLLVGVGAGRPFGGRPGGPPWMRGRWDALSPEERAKIREDVRRRCGP